jgi:hypothetical protein
MHCVNQGNALSISFFDPEENAVEVYLDAAWHVMQPHGDALDLDELHQRAVVVRPDHYVYGAAVSHSGALRLSNLKAALALLPSESHINPTGDLNGACIIPVG